MSLNSPSSAALLLAQSLQQAFVTGLEECATKLSGDSPIKFQWTEWQRNGGKNGGGSRYFTEDNMVFNRASVNVSHIHYADDPDKKLASATAISTIIHPQNPHAPSIHIHISWTEMKGAGGYWRMMADLNPSIPMQEDQDSFYEVFRETAPGQLDEALAQGDKYFYIPALERHRGTIHFYLEQYRSSSAEDDLNLATRFGEKVTSRYLEVLSKRLELEVSDEDRQNQLAYHTLYLFQVLTLDRGTTSGLLVHDENDLGIMGSLPSRVNKPLLQSWITKMPEAQQKLLEDILVVLPGDGEVSNEVRVQLAQTVRSYYRQYPESLKFQASGNIVPPTVKNHK